MGRLDREGGPRPRLRWSGILGVLPALWLDRREQLWPRRSWPRGGSVRSGARCLPSHPLLVDLAQGPPSCPSLSALSLLRTTPPSAPPDSPMEFPTPHPPRDIKRRPTAPPRGARTPRTSESHPQNVKGKDLPLRQHSTWGQHVQPWKRQTAGCEHTARAGGWE